MKLKILTVVMLALASLTSLAQDIEYGYDDAGNRITRKIIGPKMEDAPSAANSTEENYKSGNQESEVEVYNDMVGEKQIKIYPNPTRGKLKIDMVNYNNNLEGSIQVFDISGRMVNNIPTLTETMQIDITNEPAGSYIMIIVVGNEKSEWKIVKQ
jgi:hypothetical protein